MQASRPAAPSLKPHPSRSVQMMNFGKNVTAAAVLVSILSIGLSGCQKEGPAERAGKQVDKAVEKTGQVLEKTGEKIRDTAKSATK